MVMLKYSRYKYEMEKTGPQSSQKTHSFQSVVISLFGGNISLGLVNKLTTLSSLAFFHKKLF